MTRRLALALAAIAAPLQAQSLPFHRPLNPTSTSRSGLYAQPYVAFSPTRGHWSVDFNYGNAIEDESGASGAYLLDAELMRTTVGYTRDLSGRFFLGGEAELLGSYAGFTDGFFFWYHRLIGYDQPERDTRPRNTYGYAFVLPDGTRYNPPATPIALGDVRVTLGLRHDLHQQTVLSVTLPTGTGHGNLTRGTVSASLIHTLNLPLADWFIYEGTLGVGVTPRHGPLAPYQRTAFFSGSTGIRFRVWGQQWIYGYFWYQTPYYHDTTLPSLDRHEVTGDFGWIMRGKRGKEWRFGLAEDLTYDDPGIDLILKVSRTW